MKLKIKKITTRIGSETLDATWFKNLQYKRDMCRDYRFQHSFSREKFHDSVLNLLAYDGPSPFVE